MSGRCAVVSKLNIVHQRPEQMKSARLDTEVIEHPGFFMKTDYILFLEVLPNIRGLGGSLVKHSITAVLVLLVLMTEAPDCLFSLLPWHM